MSFRLSSRSRARLVGVHPALIAVVEAAIARSPVDFMITEGLRTGERVVVQGVDDVTQGEQLP